MHWPRLILILGLLLSDVALAQTASPPLPGAETAEGYYRLISGTDNCPTEVEWAEDCDGFALYPSSQGASMDTIRFCQINRGFKVLQSPGKKVLREVVSRDNYITKKETTLYLDKDNSLSLLQEDTVIQDGPKKFLWEHSRNGRGYSCLYTR